MAAWIKMPLGRKVGLGPVDFMLDGNPAPLPKERAEPPIFSLCLLWPNGWMDQDGIGMEVGLSPGNFVLDGDPAPPSQFLAHVYCGQTAGWIKMPLGTEVGLSLGYIVLDMDAAPPP